MIIKFLLSFHIIAKFTTTMKFGSSKVIILILFIMIFYIGFVFYSDISKVSTTFLSLNPIFIPFVLLSSFIGFLIRSKRQQFLLSKIGVKISFKDSFFLYFSGLSMIVTPGGAGEVIKSQYLKNKTGNPRSKTIPVFLLERLFDFLGISSFLLLTLFFHQLFATNILVVISFILLFLGFLLFKNSKYLIAVFKKLTKIRFFKNIPYNSDEFLTSTDLLCKNKNIVYSWSITFASMAFDALSIYLAFLSFSIEFDYFLTTQLTFTSILFGTLSLIPGGVGITEGSLVGFLVGKDIEISFALALVLFIRLTTLWFVTILGFLFTRIILKNNNKFPENDN